MCNAPKSGRSKTSLTEENKILAAMRFVDSPKNSTRRASRQLSIPGTSLRRLVNKLKLKPYHLRQVHCLLLDDPDGQLQFCESIRAHITNEQPDFLDNIMWSDETCLNLSGHVNNNIINNI